jgi:3-(3-hydroxy-phenyl)propionate hydroxylase
VLRNTMASVALRKPDARTTALRESVAELLRMDEPRRRLAAELSGLGVQYDLGFADGEKRPAQLGRRMPDLDLITADGPRRLYSLLHDARPVLLSFDGPNNLDIGAWKGRLKIAVADSVDHWELPAVGTVQAPAAVLIRPDGYVAWVKESPRLLTDVLTEWFGAST